MPSWKKAIRSIKYDELNCDRTRREKFASAARDFQWEGTVLLKEKSKVIAVSEVIEIERSKIIMCTYQEIEYGLKAIKIRRPKRLRQLIGHEIDQKSKMIITWVDCWNL